MCVLPRQCLRKLTGCYLVHRPRRSYAYKVNGGKASIAGSHVQYVDYDRGMFANFMESSLPASRMVTGMGEMVERMYNLKGEEVGRRNGTGETTVGAHYSNTDANGTYVAKKVPAEADWLLMSLCSAHLEQKHQWGEGIGLEDDVFITNEEWSKHLFRRRIIGPQNILAESKYRPVSLSLVPLFFSLSNKCTMRLASTSSGSR